MGRRREEGGAGSGIGGTGGRGGGGAGVAATFGAHLADPAGQGEIRI